MSARLGQGLVLALTLVPLALVSLRDCEQEDRRSSAREAVAELGDLSAATAVAGSRGPRSCPSAPGSALGGSVGPTPPLALDCNKSPTKHCSSALFPTRGPARYWRGAWYVEPMWRAIGVALTRPHAFHYALTTAIEPGSKDRCRFTARAHGDLDGDGAFSTLAVSGVVDEGGATLEWPWRLVDPLE